MKPPNSVSLQDEISRLTHEIEKHQLLLSDPELAGLATEEIEKLSQQRAILEKSLHPDLSPQATTATSRPLHSRSAIMEIRPGAGGEEAKIWADDLMRMYVRFCEILKLKTVNVDEGIMKISGSINSSFVIRHSSLPLGPYGLLRFESGVHRVQRIPQTEAHGRIHTSTASVAVLPEITAAEVQISDSDLSWAFSRSGGPGGQNVNKVNTAVRLTYLPTDTVISVRAERSQPQNREIALQLLRQRLWESQQEKQLKTLEAQRAAAIGRGMRPEKIRTYNFPQNRVTDHRINRSWHNLEAILEGNLPDIISACQSLSVVKVSDS